MVPRMYSQNNVDRLSAKLLFLSNSRYLKKLTAFVAFVSNNKNVEQNLKAKI